MSRLAALRVASISCVVFVLGPLAACGSSDGDPAASGPPAVDSGGPPSTVADSGSHDDASSPPGDASKSDGDAAVGAAADPSKDGPYTPMESDVSVAAATGDTLTLHVVVPSAGPTAGPFPVVFIAPGYTISTDQYFGYAKRLASHGIAGVTVGFTQTTDQLEDAKNLQAALDWANAPGATLATTLDAKRAGVMGHSRGGKAAVLAAARDPRFKSVLGLDPVDSVPSFPSCSPGECPDASEAMATLAIPSGFLGETLDESGTLAACAPAADNYMTFYASALSPSFQVTIAGAGHISFVDAPGSCFFCVACKTPTASQSVVLDLAYSYTAAFFLRNLTANPAYDSYLVGATAVARYVTPGIATIDSK